MQDLLPSVWEVVSQQVTKQENRPNPILWRRPEHVSAFVYVWKTHLPHGVVKTLESTHKNHNNIKLTDTSTDIRSSTEHNQQI